MRSSARPLVVAVVAAFAGVALGALAPRAAAASPLYDRYCLPCHGAGGAGDGPAAPWLWPRPRDLTRGEYKWRSTPSNRPPTDEDLARVIRRGAPGTSMPGFEGVLTDAQIAELVDVVKAFAPRRFEAGRRGTPVAVPAPTAEPSVERGRALFREAGCAACHGDEGRGDGPAAAALRDADGRPAAPYDLTASPLRRAEGGPRDIVLTLATGLAGTAMPDYSSLPADDLWALAAFVDAIRFRDAESFATRTSVSPLAAGDATYRAGLFVEPQGEPPASLPPAASSLSSAQCGRCHAKQLREWKTSLHARTSSPGLLAQLVNAKPDTVKSCLKCHAPLAEQLPSAPGYDEALSHEGVTCASCHVRGWVRRGPPPRPDATPLGIASYPFVVDPAYERSDFCLPCHQLPPSNAVNGRPLLNTYREWLEGPYMRRGVQCQHCHMPDREHTWRGAHDPETVRQGLRLDTRGAREGGAVAIDVVLENVGAGHYLPTTPTPAAWVVVELLDDRGRVLDRRERRIGRHLVHEGGWKELEDTRLPPGEPVTFPFAWRGDPAARAKRARISVTFAPDEYYERFYRRQLGRKLPEPSRRLYEEALARAVKARFLVTTRELALP